MTSASHRDTGALSTALYLSTKTLHHEAETTGIIRHLLRGEASRDGYILFMRNLLPAYRALEQGLAAHRESPMLAGMARFDFDRASAIEADLGELDPRFGSLPLLPEAEAYAGRIAQSAEGDGAGLIAHAYTRYLGDLSGGQILKRLLMKSLGLRDPELSFYDFTRFPNAAALKNDYRTAIDAAAATAPEPATIITEAATAFIHNIAVSQAVETFLAGGAALAVSRTAS